MNVVFENVLENKEMGKVLDDWTMTYEYDYYQENEGLGDFTTAERNEKGERVKVRL